VEPEKRYLLHLNVGGDPLVSRTLRSLSFAAVLFVLPWVAALPGSSRPPEQPAARKPKLVVVLVIDQLRADYLERFHDRFGPDGFNRLLREGAYFSLTERH
jgi:predicted AlkP superfamily pyrophosphatase or phosphodiesterase